MKYTFTRGRCEEIKLLCDGCCRAYALEIFCNDQLISVLSILTESNQEIKNTFAIDKFTDKNWTTLVAAEVDMNYFIDRDGFTMDWALQIYGLA